jgi:hypothetical protein
MRRCSHLADGYFLSSRRAHRASSCWFDSNRAHDNMSTTTPVVERSGDFRPDANPESWQMLALEQERREAQSATTERELAIGDWAFAVDIPERG